MFKITGNVKDGCYAKLCFYTPVHYNVYLTEGFIWRFMEELQTFGCTAARTASIALSRSIDW